MSKPTINWSVLRDISWWHWLLTIPLLAAHLSGVAGALVLAMVLCAAMAGYYWLELREVHPYPVQIRIAYLALLATGMLPQLQWVLWVPMIGTTAMVAVGYCALHRLLRLAPFNRVDSLTPGMVWRVFVQDPCVGGLVQWNPDASRSQAGCCSLTAAPVYSSCSLSGRSAKEDHQHAATH
jgi:hypothetical protein